MGGINYAKQWLYKFVCFNLQRFFVRTSVQGIYETAKIKDMVTILKISSSNNFQRFSADNLPILKFYGDAF